MIKPVMKHSAWLASLLLLWIPSTVIQAAELRLAAIFSDHMVLQREKPVPVWGWADPGESVTVEFAGQKKSADAAQDGRWMVRLDPLSASSEPRRLVVTTDAEEKETQSVDDVLVGEVWLGSGQSNMAMTVNRARDFEAERAGADLPRIRMFRESSGASESPQEDARGEWTVCSPETVGSFSATLFFFGRELHRALDVPIGLINSSVGGTPIESWIAAEAQARTIELKEAYNEAARAYADFDRVQGQRLYEEALRRWKERAEKAKAAGKPVPRRPVNPVDRRDRRGGPGGLFNAKIAPLIPYAIRGALWYQGEANSQAGKGDLYQYQLPLLVRDWRERWGEQLPFAWVQLPNFRRDGEGWMLVREGMLKTLRLPRTGMAITVDIGEADDIHPRNKQDVGRRLALWALGDVYEREGIVTSGPLPSKHEIRDDKIIVTFVHTDGGLEAKGDTLKGFEIVGSDGTWKPAKAVIEGETVVISHPDVEKPVAARYSWKADPDGNLFNGAGLPASPFRTGNGRK